MLPSNAALEFALLLTSLGAGMLASLILSLEHFASRSAFARCVHQFLSRFLTPRIVWAAVLLASLVVSRYLAANLVQSLDVPQEQHAVDLQDLPVLDRHAYTDQGRPVALFHFTLHTSAEEIERFMQASENQQRQVIRLADANPATNCHGWIFTGGEYGVRDSDVRAILDDNGYVAVEQPRDGDVAIYIRDGQIVHAGLARQPQPQGPILVESKWGPFGLYLHPPDKQPFSGVCQFFRSPRAGHAIRLSPPASLQAAE